MQGQGNGPIDAFAQALGSLIGQSVRVVDYQQHAIAEGADARAMAYIELRLGDSPAFFGVGADSDTSAAAMQALLSGLNRARAAGWASESAPEAAQSAVAVA